MSPPPTYEDTETHGREVDHCSGGLLLAVAKDSLRLPELSPGLHQKFCRLVSTLLFSTPFRIRTRFGDIFDVAECWERLAKPSRGTMFTLSTPHNLKIRDFPLTTKHALNCSSSKTKNSKAGSVAPTRDSTSRACVIRRDGSAMVHKMTCLGLAPAQMASRLSLPSHSSRRRSNDDH